MVDIQSHHKHAYRVESCGWTVGRPGGWLWSGACKFLALFVKDLFGRDSRLRVIDRCVETSPQKLFALIGIQLELLGLSEQNEIRLYAAAKRSEISRI